VPEGLLAPRLYRAAFVPALFALIVLAFSLQEPAGPAAPELSPPGFSALRAEQFAAQAVGNYGARESGSIADKRMAELMAARIESSGFTTSSSSFSATTLSGRRELRNVVGIRPGPSDRRLLVIASRDGAKGELLRSGALESGILVELARVLEGRTFEHTLVLASVSGGVDGGLGAARLTQSLRGPFDAVLVLRNVGSKVERSPVLAAGDSRMRPDERYVRTVRRIAAIEFAQASTDQRRSVLGQVVRLGFPLALGEQASFAAAGLSAVSVSPGGESLGSPGADSGEQVRDSGQIALRTLTTMDNAFRLEPPASTPILVGGKLIPQWALVLLIAGLLFPLVVAAIDAWARARRRLNPSQRGLLAPAIAFGWLLVIAFLLRGIGLTGMIDAPALAPNPAGVSGIAATVFGVLAILLGLAGVLVGAAAARQASPKGGEAAFALWIVFAGLAVFAVNPIAAGFLLPLLHLSVLLLLASDTVRRRSVALCALIGLLPLLIAVVYYVSTFEIGVGGILRYAVLLEAGGFISPAALVVGSAATAALGTALIQLWWSAPRPAATGTRRPLAQPF
jgi:hypothetical protein